MNNAQASRSFIRFANKAGYTVHAEIPGLRPEEIHLEVNGPTLTLSGERKTEHEEKKAHYLRMERTYPALFITFRIMPQLTRLSITS